MSSYEELQEEFPDGIPEFVTFEGFSLRIAIGDWLWPEDPWRAASWYESAYFVYPSSGINIIPPLVSARIGAIRMTSGDPEDLKTGRKLFSDARAMEEFSGKQDSRSPDRLVMLEIEALEKWAKKLNDELEDGERL